MRAQPCRVFVVASGVMAVSLAVGCRRAPEPACAICEMPIPSRTVTSVEIDGIARQVCDPRCALTHQRQARQAIRLIRVTDFESGEALDPREAFYLTGSATAPDVVREAIRTTQDPAYLQWHRCLPSVLAFRTQEAATVYQRRHGGEVQRFEALGYAGSVRVAASPR